MHISQGIKGYKFDMYQAISDLMVGKKPKHNLISKFSSYDALCHYAQRADDAALSGMLTVGVSTVKYLKLVTTSVCVPGVCCLGVYACMFLCTRTCMFLCTHTYTCMFLCVFVLVCLCMCVNICVCMVQVCECYKYSLPHYLKKISRMSCSDTRIAGEDNQVGGGVGRKRWLALHLDVHV